MLETGIDQSRILEQVSAIHSSTYRMNKIINGLRFMSRKGEEDLPESFPLSAILEDVLHLSMPRLSSYGIDLEMKGSTSIKIQGNPVQISQVILNLLNNSIDAVKDRKEKWISLEIAQHEPFIRISVIDSGTGIPENIAAKMMDPFFTTKEAGKGTGLGLSISKNIIHRNKGQFYFDQASDHTKFVIELPAGP